MEHDELLFHTPPSTARRLLSVQPSPPRLSDLLAAFGARSLPVSSSRMSRDTDKKSNVGLRPERASFTYAESEGSSSPVADSAASSFNGSPASSKTSSRIEESAESAESEDELHQNDDDCIRGTYLITFSSIMNYADFDQVAARPSVASRKLPERSSRSTVNYATPKKIHKKKRISNGRRSVQPIKLTSDLSTGNPSRPSKQRPETERNKIRNEIAEHTKPKRDRFLLAHQEYFLPLLPQNNYIAKLSKLHGINGQAEIGITHYEQLDDKPSGVTATMKPYQLEGLSFLLYMHNNGMSAILGDEMGLGKTLQALSLFQHLQNNTPIQGEHRPCLVVCPLSVLSSWMNEAKRWVPELKVVRFHGPKREREKLMNDCRIASKDTKIDVIVTTYETFVAESGWFKRAFVWRYCILDEGHKIKNSQSDVSRSLQSLRAEFRLLLTGTPLQNNLHEAWALLHWLYPEVFTEDTGDNFKQAFDLTKGRVSTSFMDDARHLLELVMLRRLKSSPGVDLGLPPKEEILLFVPLTPMQRFWYQRFLTRVDTNMLDTLFKGAKAKEVKALQIQADEDAKDSKLLQMAQADLADPLAADDVWAESKEIMAKAVQNEEVDTNSSDWRKLMNLVMQLRKVCSHPYVLPNAAPDPYYLGEHIKAASGKFIVLDKLVEELVIKKRKKLLIFSGFTNTLDLCEDLLMMKGANTVGEATFRYLRLDGGTARARRNLGIRMFNDKKSEFQVMLISTRAGGLGINLASASDVVFMDEDWNPQITIQAEARAHRIGQTQKVTVYKLCTQGTVEEQMMGRIRKKLYLSAKITESMRNIHSPKSQGKKRKRGRPSIESDESDKPQLDANSLKSLVRRGAQTLSRPQVDVTEMLNWDFETMLEQCKDKPLDLSIAADDKDVDEQTWLNTMEKVECAVFEGKKHQKQLDKAAKTDVELDRAGRRVGKNTTVMVDGFAINKESMACGDWEAVPTMAGKDPRLAEPVKIKKAAINNQDFCQHCWDGGEIILCSGCPRSYHVKCMDREFQQKAKGWTNFSCPQHECRDCGSKTAEAGGLIYRCRWCQHGYCEDCLDWDHVNPLGETLPEYELLGYQSKNNAWFVECPDCIKHWTTDPEDRVAVDEERKRIAREYEAYMAAMADSVAEATPKTISEVSTPMAMDFVNYEGPAPKKAKYDTTV